MDDETNQQEDTADLEADASANGNSDDTQSDQNTGEVTDEQEPKKQPKIWQVVRGIQKSLEEIQKTSKTSQPSQTEGQQSNGDLSPKDLYALMDAKVPQQDVDEVVKAAKLLGKSVPEALQDSLVKARLSQLAEERKTSEVTNTNGSKRTTAKVTDEQLIDKANKGEQVDPEALAEARLNSKRKK